MRSRSSASTMGRSFRFYVDGYEPEAFSAVFPLD
jgi:hypothetical protein